MITRHNLDERLLEECKTYHPYLADNIVQYQPRGDFSLRITLHNGDKYLYNGIQKTILKEQTYADDEFTEKLFYKLFSAKLVYMMSMKGYSQKDLAEATGIGYGTISNYINVRTKPTFYNICRIARVLKCDVGELVDF